MAELATRTHDLDGLLLASNGFTVIETDGLEDSADLERDEQDATGDGTFGGVQRLADRLVVLTLGYHSDTTEAQKDALRAKASPRVNRQSKRLFRWRHNGVTKRVEYTPASGRSLAMGGDMVAINYGFAKGNTLRLQVDDPVIYADTPTVLSFSTAGPGLSSDYDTVTNAGSLTAVSRGSSSLGALSWTITAGPSGCTWPFFQHVDHLEEFWMLQEALEPGDVVTVAPDRIVRVNGARRHATVKGGDGRPMPLWPAMRPGDNSVRFGSFAGSIDATLTFRSTW